MTEKNVFWPNIFAWEESYQFFENLLLFPLKVHSQIWQFLATESPLKMIKNAFYFTLKVLFVLEIF